MIWTYAITEANTLEARDAHSLGELQTLDKKVCWLWIDCMEPNNEELEIIAGLVGETDVTRTIRNHQSSLRWRKINDYVLLFVPQVTFKRTIKTHLLYIFAKADILITVRSQQSSKSIDNALKTFEDCTSRVCERGIASSFVVNRLLNEVSDENLDVVMALRERSEELEEMALLNPKDKQIGREVFSLKREISTLERILWNQRELMLSIEEGVVPIIQSSELDDQTLSHAVSNVSRELSLISSNDDALDSILTLQDLGMIHRVEKILISLTLVTLIVNILMILVEVNIVKILSG
ncbi:MAG: CorA family divalent cation transporter [Candidatus Bathyarchaeota archaeon]|jgi:Mg2+ and Co2+ transporter CorA